MKAYFLKECKKKVNIVILLLILAVLFVGVYGLVKPLRQATLMGNYEFTTGQAVDNQTVYTGIPLPAGVWQVDLTYETDRPLGYHCTVTDATVRPGALLTNGENLYAGKGVTGFRLWLLEDTEALEIKVSYDGQGTLRTGKVTLRETRGLGGIIFTTGLFAMAVFVGMLCYRSFDAARGIAAGTKKAVFGVLVITAMASVPYLLGVSMDAGDLVYHLHRIEGIADGLIDGQFPVRIEPEWVHGHGYASGIFYCNLLLYFPAILRIAGFPITLSYNVYCVLVNLATAAIAYFCFRKIFQSRQIGLVCSALYTLSGIRIFKTVLTGAVGENNAMMFLPLILYGFFLVFGTEVHVEQRKKAWLPLGIGFAGVLQTHVLTCEITAFLTVILCVVMVRRVFTKECFQPLFWGAVTALGLSLWFLIPFIDYFFTQDMHIKHVSGRTIQMMGLRPLQLLFGWADQGEVAGMGGVKLQETTPAAVGWFLVLAVVIFAGMCLFGLWKKQSKDIAGLGVISALFGILMMAMSLKAFPWDAIQQIHPLFASLVSSLQFPNRFLGWGTLFGVTAVGCILWYLQKENKKYITELVLAAAVVSVVTGGLHLNDAICKHRTSFTLYNVEGMGRGYISGAEYLIEGTDGNTLLYRAPMTSEGVTVESYEKGGLQARVACRNPESKNGFVDLPLLLYRGYRAVDVQTGEELALQYGENNTVCVNIPAGYQGEFEVRFIPPWYWRVGERISLFSYILILSYCFMKKSAREIIDGEAIETTKKEVGLGYEE